MKCKLTATFTNFNVFLFVCLFVCFLTFSFLHFVYVHEKFSVWGLWDVRQKQFLAVYSQYFTKIYFFSCHTVMAEPSPVGGWGERARIPLLLP